MPDGHRFVTIQARGVLAPPRDVRARHGLDEPGTQVEVVERDDGVIELHPQIDVPAEQAWFWSGRWQRMEREVDEQVARGELKRFESSDALLDELERISPAA